jgi:hypothetical protein
MATADLQTFIEDRLRATFPTVDLAAGSPAQVSFVQPLLQKLGTDPFDTDIDRFAGDPSAIRDTFVKPLILLLEPFKREVQAIKQNKSLLDPSLLSDDDADALVANVFDYRTSGRFATGVARIFFQNPTAQQIEISDTFYTANGLNFLPLNPINITAEEMIYNRQGSLFFMDVPLRAEKEGTEYNVDADTIVGVIGVYGYVKVSNPRRFSDGATKMDTPTFVAAAREALNERSLVSRRGANARIRHDFQGTIRAIQVIGAKDPEMMRDILVATGPGHAWMTGKVTFYKHMAWVSCYTVDGDVSPPVPGDKVYWYDGNQKRAVIAEVFGSDFGPSGGPSVATFLVRLETKNYDTVTEVYGGFERKGTVAVSSLPSIGKVSLTLNNQEVHVYGHADVYVRPVAQDVSKAVLSSLSDAAPVLEDSTLSTLGASVTPADRCRVSVPGGDLSAVRINDLLTIEEGDDAGTYRIVAVSGTDLYLPSDLSQSATNLRFRISRFVSINPFEPKIRKLPFGEVQSNDAQTIIGSNVVNFTMTDVLNYGVRTGDILRLKSGLDAGDYTITGFTSGLIITVDKEMKSSSAGIEYEIFTSLDPVVRPLVRLKEIAVLDSSRKSTGIVVPSSEPVAVVPQSDFTTARVRSYSQTASGFVLPAIDDGVVDYLVTRNNIAANAGDRRYSLNIDPTEGGVYKTAVMADGTKAELLFPPDADETCSYFMATCEDTAKAENFPPIDPRPGECLTIKNGPNKGSYLIKQVRKFKYKVDVGGTRSAWIYFVKIYGTFPVDIFRQFISFLEDNGEVVAKIPDNITFPDFFVSSYDGLGAQMDAALTTAGVTSPGATALQGYLDGMFRCEYEWGDPARGVLRSYFVHPTVFQQSTGGHAAATTFDFETKAGEVVSFRPDPNRYLTHNIVPPKLSGEPDAKDYPRDSSVSGSTVTFLDAGATPFNKGVLAGDSLEIYEEVFLHTNKQRETAVKTVANSTKVESPTSLFTDPALVGNLLVIQEGLDKGVYRVIGRSSDNKYLTLDRPLRASTPTIVEAARACTYQESGGDNQVIANSLEDLSAKDWATTQKYLTLYAALGNRAGVEAGTDSSFFCGSYRILGVAAGGVVTVDRAGMDDFPAAPAAGIFVVTDGPATAPKVYGDGTELVALRPVRIYSDVVETYPVATVTKSPSTKTITVTGTPKDGYRQPYRIYRKNLRRITSTEMSEKRDGFLYYFDTEVVSLSPSPVANILKNSYLTPRVGTYESIGYAHTVEDNTLSYSMKEEGTLVLPAAILPVNSPDAPDNYISLVGTPVQISYERADAVAALQEFLDSPEDRVASANMLARHFLPAYVSYDVLYSGGSAPSVLVKDILDYVNNLPVETPLDISEMEKMVTKRGGNPETPTKASITIHDWDRKMWVEFGDNELGGTQTEVPYNGTPRVCYFIPGYDPSTSTETSGERINLESL